MHNAEGRHQHDDLAELGVAVLVSIVSVELAESVVLAQALAERVHSWLPERFRVQDLDLPKQTIC
jgi:hypothetical protein